MNAPTCPDCHVQLELSHICSYTSVRGKIYIVGFCLECNRTFKGVVGRDEYTRQIIAEAYDVHDARGFALLGMESYILYSPDIFANYAPGTYEYTD